MRTQAVVRKWGNSVGIILPKEVVEKEQLKTNQKIIVDIIKPTDLSHLFGTLKTKKSAQQFKDEVRKGWM